MGPENSLTLSTVDVMLEMLEMFAAQESYILHNQFPAMMASLKLSTHMLRTEKSCKLSDAAPEWAIWLEYPQTYESLPLTISAHHRNTSHPSTSYPRTTKGRPYVFELKSQRRQVTISLD